MQTQSQRLLDRVNALLDRMPLRSGAEETPDQCHQFWNYNMIGDMIERRFIHNMNTITGNRFEPSIKTPFDFDKGIHFTDFVDGATIRTRFNLKLSEFFHIITKIVELSIREYESLLSMHIDNTNIIIEHNPTLKAVYASPDDEYEEIDNPRRTDRRFEAAKLTYNEAIAYFCRDATPFQSAFKETHEKIIQMSGDIFKQFRPQINSEKKALVYTGRAYDCIEIEHGQPYISMADAILRHRYADNILPKPEVFAWSMSIPNIYQIISQDETAEMTLFDTMMETEFGLACEIYRNTHPHKQVPVR
jgi:hypothetical protein